MPSAAQPPSDAPAPGASYAGPVKLHTRDYARTTLKARHRPVVRAFAEALFHHGQVGAHVGAHLNADRFATFDDEVDRFISPASKTLRFALMLMLDAIRWLPIFVVGRFALFEDLPLDLRIEMLRRLEHSRVTELTLILVAYKTLMTILYFEDERELKEIGYPGPARERWKRKPQIALIQPAADEPRSAAS